MYYGSTAKTFKLLSQDKQQGFPMQKLENEYLCSLSVRERQNELRP